jgi:hypothetical protein
MSATQAQLFKSEWYLRLLFDLVLLFTIPLCTSIVVFTFSHAYTGDDVVEARIVSVLLLLFGCPLFFMARLGVPNIVVDGDGIGWWIWGCRLMYIRWIDVKIITVEIVAAYNQIPSTATIYSFYKTDKTPNFHLLHFDDHFPNANALVDTVDQYVRQHEIPVLDRRGDGSAKTKRYFLWVPVSKTEVRRNSIK